MGSKNRDDFTSKTIDILAKRVGYLCSNPACRRHTVGTNEVPEKPTILGVASHITAASAGGARYDDTFTPEQRKHIDNGIWLCPSCSVLIDKDPIKYPKELLVDWKLKAEEESGKRLSGEIKNLPIGKPIIETDLIWIGGGRKNNGLSDKNPYEEHNGRRIYISGNKPIMFWTVYWNFTFLIYNNSNSGAYNMQVESIGDTHFSNLDKLPKINNLPPLQNIDLCAKYENFIEADYSVADDMLKSKIPPDFNKLKLKIKYLDEQRNQHFTIVEFNNGEITNKA